MCIDYVVSTDGRCIATSRLWLLVSQARLCGNSAYDQDSMLFALPWLLPALAIRIADYSLIFHECFVKHSAMLVHEG